jgi:hypothetical protein
MMRALVMLPLALLTACSASLDVRVATLDPEYVRDQVATQSETNSCRSAVAEAPASIDAEIMALAVDLKAHHELVYRAYVAGIGADAGAHRAALMQIADEVRISTAEATRLYGLDDYRQARINAMLAVDQAAASAAPCAQRSAALNAALHARNGLIAGNAAQIGAQLELLRKHGADGATPAPAAASPVALANAAAEQSVAADPVVAQSGQAITRKATSALGSGAMTLSTSPYAYLISSAPEDYWQPNFNQAFGSGTMGNLDIAIILNETADFSVKGMRFDASKVAEVASKVTSQALHLAVQMTGVAPLAAPAAAPAPNASALAQSTAALANAQQQAAVQDSMLQTRSRALFDLADTLSANYGLVTDANAAATAASIRARLDAQLPLLKLQVPAPSP